MKNYARLIKVSLIMLAFICSSFSSFSQSAEKFNSYWYVKASLGVSNGYTDFINGDLNLAGDIGFGRQFSPIIGLEFKTLAGKLSGTQAVTTNLYESKFYDFSINAVFNLSNLIWGYQDRDWSLYSSIGFGHTQYKAMRVLNGGTSYYGYSTSPAALQGDGFGSRRIVATIPFSLGIDYRISSNLSANFNFRMNWVDSDLLDGYASGTAKDLYSYTSVGLTYKFGNRKSKKAYQPKESKVIIPPPPPIEKEQPKAEPKKVVEKTPPPPPKEKVVAKPKPKVAVKAQKKVMELEYRVQIRACFKVKCDLALISETYNISESQIMVDFHKNYYIYTVGSFKTMEEAERKKEMLKSKNKVTDAFVVTFKNGKRYHP